MKERTVQEKRFARALATIGALALALAAMAATAAWADGDAVEGGGTYVGRVWGQVAAGEDFDDAMELAGLTRLGGDAMPPWAGELCAPERLEGAYGNDDLSLVGFTMDGTKEEAARVLDGELAARGWMEQNDGRDGVAAYTKNEGSCRWVMAEATEAGGAVSVVLHMRHI